jgi:hypothetical protein
METHPKVDVYSAAAARAAVSIFFNIADEWKLTPAQQMQLLAVPRATYYQWRKNPERVPRLDRVAGDNYLERSCCLTERCYRSIFVAVPRCLVFPIFSYCFSGGAGGQSPPHVRSVHRYAPRHPIRTHRRESAHRR